MPVSDSVDLKELLGLSGSVCAPANGGVVTPVLPTAQVVVGPLKPHLRDLVAPCVYSEKLPMEDQAFTLSRSLPLKRTHMNTTLDILFSSKDYLVVTYTGRLAQGYDPHLGF